MCELRLLTRDAVLPLANLRVRPEQARFVAPNAITMAQAVFEPGAAIYGIWNCDVPVGMIAVVDLSHPEQELEDGDDQDALDVWRLMVSADHQGRGYGRAALCYAIKLARKKGLGHVSVSSVDAAGSAVPFYEQFGFLRTGRIIDGEVQLSRSLR